MEVCVDKDKINKRRVVVTGIGIHTSIGKNKKEVIEAIKLGNCGKKEVPISRFDTSNDAYINKGAHLLDEDIFTKLQDIDESVVTELSIQVIKEAIEDSELRYEEIQGYNCGISLAISTGTSFSFIKWLNKKIDG